MPAFRKCSLKPWGGGHSQLKHLTKTIDHEYTSNLWISPGRLDWNGFCLAATASTSAQRTVRSAEGHPRMAQAGSWVDGARRLSPHHLRSGPGGLPARQRRLDGGRSGHCVCRSIPPSAESQILSKQIK